MREHCFFLARPIDGASPVSAFPSPSPRGGGCGEGRARPEPCPRSGSSEVPVLERDSCRLAVSLISPVASSNLSPSLTPYKENQRVPYYFFTQRTTPKSP